MDKTPKFPNMKPHSPFKGIIFMQSMVGTPVRILTTDKLTFENLRQESRTGVW